jgi:LysR family hydrogen peroxide-inducible transcriptional activator
MTTLRQLQYLLAVADSQHFGRAAAAVHVAQPTLSQQLRALEARLGVTLVERGDNPVSLTPVGREIAARARKFSLALPTWKIWLSAVFRDSQARCALA